MVDKLDYLPYGELFSYTPACTAADTSHKFTGKERDGESGLDNFGARYDSSWMGRFMSPDPENTSGFAHMDDPQGWNGYSYVRNNPLLYSDPDGMNYTVCQQVENSRIEQKNCTEITDDQYDQWRKDNQNLSVSAGGSIYSGNNKIGSAYYYNEKVGETLQEAGARADVGVKAAMVATAPNYVVAAGAAAAAGGGTLIDLTAHGLVRTVGTRLMQMEATATVFNATKQFIQPNGRKVFVEQVGSKFNVVITEGGRAVNTFRNLSQNALDRMARNYKWR